MNNNSVSVECTRSPPPSPPPPPPPYSETIPESNNEISKKSATSLRLVMMIYCPIIMIVSSIYLFIAPSIMSTVGMDNETDGESVTKLPFNHEDAHTHLMLQYVTITMTAISSNIVQIFGYYGATRSNIGWITLYNWLSIFVSLWYFLLTIEFSTLYLVAFTFFIEGLVFGHFTRRAMINAIGCAQVDLTIQSSDLDSICVQVEKNKNSISLN